MTAADRHKEALLLIISLAEAGMLGHAGIVARRAVYANHPTFDDIRELIRQAKERKDGDHAAPPE